MYLNIEDNEWDNYIYRIISYDRFLELFNTNKNTLVKPKLWEDTFENFTLKSRLKYPDGRVIELDIHERLYGQCWTTSRASDAMWRIYSPDKKGIRIRTTIEKLLSSLEVANIDVTTTKSCMGKVDYISEAKITEQAKKAFSDNGQITFDSLFRSLLVKRNAFKHENEIRLIHLDWGCNLPQGDVYSYDIEPYELITQVMIDPRVSSEEFRKIKNDIHETTGYQGDIKRSLLYRLPKHVTVEVNQDLMSSLNRDENS